MKKFLLTALVMLSLATLAKAGPLRDTPVGPEGALITADYGGVLYSTASFPWGSTAALGVRVTTVCINAVSFTCKGVFYGVIFTSGTTFDFVDVFDSTSTDAGNMQGAITRLYNVSGSTGGVGASAQGFSGPPKPIRFSEGLFIRPNTGAYNSITTLYSQER